MKGHRFLALTVVCFALGVGLVAQLRARRSQSPASVPGVDQSGLLGSLVVANAELRSEVEKLQGEVQAYELAPERAGLPQMNEDLRRMRIVNGSVKVVGPGVEVRVGAGVNALDLQDLLNEVRNAGAEAIDLNGVRLIVSSALASDGKGVTLNGRRIEPPFVFEAIGDPNTMSTALNRRGGVLDLLRLNYPGLELAVKTSQLVSLSVAPERPLGGLARPVH